MTDYTEYADQRRAYISEIRNSFERENTKEMPEQPEPGAWGIRVRLAASLLLFLLFFFWYDSGTKIQGIRPEQVIDLIEEDRYGTILQEVLAAGETFEEVER